MSLQPYGKNGKNVPIFLDFFVIKNKYKQVKVPNLVYFGSPSIALFNWEVTPIFALKGSVFRHQS